MPEPESIRQMLEQRYPIGTMVFLIPDGRAGQVCGYDTIAGDPLLEVFVADGSREKWHMHFADTSLDEIMQSKVQGCRHFLASVIDNTAHLDRMTADQMRANLNHIRHVAQDLLQHL